MQASIDQLALPLDESPEVTHAPTVEPHDIQGASSTGSMTTETIDTRGLPYDFGIPKVGTAEGKALLAGVQAARAELRKHTSPGK